MKDNFTKIEKSDFKKYDLLKQLADISPPIKSIYIKGTIPKDKTPIAIVGTRKASSYGKKTAYDFSFVLAKNGFLIISGLALGIDTAAHQGALDAGGQTIAVLGNGLDKIYPASNGRLGEKMISSGGCLISEYPSQTPSFPGNFLMRNRIISALASAVIVIEAPFKSGSMTTAKFAVKQKKPIFVVPGTIGSFNFEGSHKLIRNGARLITSVNDFLSDMSYDLIRGENKKIDLKSDEQKIVDELKKYSGSLSVDKICQITKLNPRNAGATLSVMVMKDIIFQDGNNYQINL